MLEVYAMRWSIEVYFKECKQHLKFLGEQTRSYVSHAASLHLTAVCYLVLVHLTLDREYCKVAQAHTLSYAQKLWEMFRMSIHKAVTGMGQRLGCAVGDVMREVDR